MLKLVQRVKRRLLRPKVLSKLVVSGLASPREKFTAGEQGQNVVYKISAVQDPRAGFDKLSIPLSSAWSELFQPEHQVLIKINLNTGDPYPASTSPEALAALVDLLHARGIQKIKVGDCSSNNALPTRKVARQTGIVEAIAGKAEMIYFDEGPWVRVPLPGTVLKEVTVPLATLEADRLIYLANLKTHILADFSFGLKLAVGCMHPLERKLLHREHLQEKAVEINLAVPPDLTIIDGRVAFVTGGPAQGRRAEAGLILAGTNQLAVDVEAYRQLYELKRQLHLEETFVSDPFQMVQLEHARQCGLGGLPWREYECIEL